MSEVIDMKELKREMRKKKLKETYQTKKQQAVKFITENKEVLAATIPAAAIIVKNGGRCISSIAKGHAARIDAKDRKTRFYDHRLGQYWYTKRPLKQAEQLEVSRRRASGESYGDIFQSMRLLK